MRGKRIRISNKTRNSHLIRTSSGTLGKSLRIEKEVRCESIIDSMLSYFRHKKVGRNMTVVECGEVPSSRELRVTIGGRSSTPHPTSDPPAITLKAKDRRWDRPDLA